MAADELLGAAPAPVAAAVADVGAAGSVAVAVDCDVGALPIATRGCLTRRSRITCER